jgi:glycosyltransferase involved in cell wall biosynthesis
VGYLARLAAQVRDIDREIRFAVIGDGAEKQRIERIAEDCGVLGITFFMLGRMPKIRAAEWLGTADMTAALFTGPRIVWKDATQNKFFDSLAAGKPIANNFDGWQCQIAVNEGVGIVLPADDLESAAKILCSKISDDEWMTNAGIAARHLAATTFSMDNHAKELRKVLERVAVSP